MDTVDTDMKEKRKNIDKLKKELDSLKELEETLVQHQIPKAKQLVIDLKEFHDNYLALRSDG